MPSIRDRVIKGDKRYAVDYIVEAHDAFKHYLNRWQFLGDSYTGGYEYFLGRYLEPYHYESRDDYEKRLRQIGLDNHVKSIVGIYNSFLFRKDVKRDLGNLENAPGINAFMKDADLDGRSFDSFIREMSALSMVYGNVWVIIDKPSIQVGTRAEELEQDIRPYVSMFTPDNVLDWEYSRQANGLYTLSYLKVKEEIVENKQYIREYTPEEVNVYLVDGQAKTGGLVSTTPNMLGRIPAVPVYAQRSPIRGVGVSAIGDIADIQRELYEMGSEVEQIIRLTNHPSLVKTADTEASAGAGAIIQMPQNLEPNLKPYLLQPNGASIDSVLNAIRQKIDGIDRMASLGGIRSIESRRLSGIGLQTEFQMLNSKLADFAMNLEHAEEKIWRCWAMYQGTSFDGEIFYPRSFSIQDKANDVAMLKMAKEANIGDLRINEELDKKIYETITEGFYEDLPNNQTPVQKNMMEHPPVTNLNDMVTHLREMVTGGYTDEEIKQLHPELAELFTRGE
ncbi:MAG: hypothetical protein CMK29_00095 [Porticoccaceae bacterium]|jgi:hypothetical protein|nr:hypothetical protein [Porticoccaceae bacterium]|tara:strand:+ start:3748 stop:5265 length:1518 start_codon:yes stop_codon:yes gene_type:complete